MSTRRQTSTAARRAAHTGAPWTLPLVDGLAAQATVGFPGWDKERVVSLRCHNGAEGELSVVQFSPGGAFDGSSCFNFMKETIHRYCGGAPNPVFNADELTLKPAAAEALRGGFGNFALYLARLPLNVLRNVHSTGSWNAPPDLRPARRCAELLNLTTRARGSPRD